MFEVLWGKKFNQSSIQNAQITSAVGEEGRLTFRNAVAVLAVLFCLHSHNSFAVTDDTIPFNIPQQRADTALTQFAEQANLTLVFPFEQLKDKTANRLVGDYPIATAINLLLRNTGLTPRFSDQLVLTIASEPKGKRMNTTNSSKRKTLLAGLVGLFAAGGMTQAVAQGGEAATGQSAIDEIIVTAAKRGTSLQDTAMAISVLSGEAIDKRGLVGMSDYLSTLPGVSMQDRGASQNSIVMRGIASDPELEDQTVGVYFGETPVTGLGVGGFAGSADIKLVDIDRVEILRGPQGSLYGDASMGGTVRVIPVSPNMDAIEGKLSTAYSNTSELGGANSKVEAIINVPLIDNQLAIRGVAYVHENSGYIRNGDANILPGLASAISLGGVASDREDIGDDQYKGFRLTALWQPLEPLSIKLTYSDQEIQQDGFPEVNIEMPGKFEQARTASFQGNSQEFLANDIAITNLVMDYDLGWASIISSSSWVDYNSSNSLDLGHAFFLPMFSMANSHTDLFVEELRFVSEFEGPVQFLAGIYYVDKDVSQSSLFSWSGDLSLDPIIAGGVTNPATGLPFDTVESTNSFPIALTQRAFFGELSYDITEQLTATVGARYFNYDREIVEDRSGWIYGGTQFVEASTNDSGSNYKVNLSYTSGDGTLVYAQWAEGFRLGAPQLGVPSACLDQNGLVAGLGTENGKPLNPDELESFELGIKTELVQRVTLNAAIYHINWEGIPVTALASCGIALVSINAGTSESEGVEVEILAHLTDKLEMSLGASYNESQLTEDIPFFSDIGKDGDNLPGSADYNVNLGLEYRFSLIDHNAFVRSDYTYVGEFYNNLAETGNAAGGYGLLNVKAGITIDQFDIDIFANNLTNANDFTWIESVYGDLGSKRAYRLRPRTFGLNVGYRF